MLVNYRQIFAKKSPQNKFDCLEDSPYKILFNLFNALAHHHGKLQN